MAMARADRAQQDMAEMRQEQLASRQESAHLWSVITAMLTRLSTSLGGDYLSLQDMLPATSVPPAPAAAPPGPAPAPPAPAAAPSGLAAAPPGPTSDPHGDYDDIFGDADFDLPDF